MAVAGYGKTQLDEPLIESTMEQLQAGCRLWTPVGGGWSAVVAASKVGFHEGANLVRIHGAGHGDNRRLVVVQVEILDRQDVG